MKTWNITYEVNGKTKMVKIDANSASKALVLAENKIKAQLKEDVEINMVGLKKVEDNDEMD